jgi:hypothetical protein
MTQIVMKREGRCLECGTGLPIGTVARFYGGTKIYGLSCHGQLPRSQPIHKALAITRDTEHRELWDKAHEAGNAAVEMTIPVPMVVQQHANQMDDNSPIVKEYLVPTGVCGFAWVVVRPGTGSFARWARKTRRGDTAYGGGTALKARPNLSGVSVQSLELNRSYCAAFAQILGDAGVPAHMESRID